VRTYVFCAGLRAIFVINFDLRLAVVKACRPPIKSFTGTLSFDGEEFLSVLSWLKGLLDWQMLNKRAVLLLSV